MSQTKLPVTCSPIDMVDVSFSTGVSLVVRMLPEATQLLEDDHVDKLALLTGMLTALAGFAQGHLGHAALLQILDEIDAHASSATDPTDPKVH